MSEQPEPYSEAWWAERIRELCAEHEQRMRPEESPEPPPIHNDG